MPKAKDTEYRDRTATAERTEYRDNTATAEKTEEPGPHHRRGEGGVHRREDGAQDTVPGGRTGTTATWQPTSTW